MEEVAYIGQAKPKQGDVEVMSERESEHRTVLTVFNSLSKH